MTAPKLLHAVDPELPSAFEPDPHERIDHLVRLLADPSDGDDVPALSGQLGLAWLEIYERDGDHDALMAGLACLRSTIAAAPTHADRARWLLWLGLGYAERGRRRHSVPDYHEAINWISAPYDSFDDAARRGATAVLTEVCWERFWLVRHGPPYDADAALAEVDRFVARTAPLLSSERDPRALSDARLLVGLVLLERYELSGERADLDRGVDLLSAASLWETLAGTPRLCQLGSELANALRRRAMLDDDLAWLDRAITAGQRTLERASSADGISWLMLHLYQALAYEERLRSDRDERDLNRAVACWRVLLDADDWAGVAGWSTEPQYHSWPGCHADAGNVTEGPPSPAA